MLRTTRTTDTRATGWPHADRSTQSRGRSPYRKGGRPTATRPSLEFLQVPQPAIENGRTPIRVRHGQLTPREVEILTLVGQGRSDPEIAERLFISPKTASVHVANVKAKLGAASRLETALRARDMGLVTGDPRS